MTTVCIEPSPFSLGGKDIEEELFAEIKEMMSQVEIGDIRYDSVVSHGFDYYYLEEGTGTHITDGRGKSTMKDEDRSGVMNVSDLFDGIVYIGCVYFNGGIKRELDCFYAWIGSKEKEPDEYKFVSMPNINDEYCM